MRKPTKILLWFVGSVLLVAALALTLLLWGVLDGVLWPEPQETPALSETEATVLLVDTPASTETETPAPTPETTATERPTISPETTTFAMQTPVSSPFSSEQPAIEESDPPRGLHPIGAKEKIGQSESQREGGLILWEYYEEWLSDYQHRLSGIGLCQGEDGSTDSGGSWTQVHTYLPTDDQTCRHFMERADGANALVSRWDYGDSPHRFEADDSGVMVCWWCGIRKGYAEIPVYPLPFDPADAILVR